MEKTSCRAGENVKLKLSGVEEDVCILCVNYRKISTLCAIVPLNRSNQNPDMARHLQNKYTLLFKIGNV